MTGLPKNPSDTVSGKFADWPDDARSTALSVRGLIASVAESHDLVVEETLKWGEPSYLCKQGTTIRLAWKQTNPDQLGLYVNCQSKLVDTYRELYPQELTLEGNRAILLWLSKPLPDSILKHCISMALNYHKLKKLPLLGA